MSLTVLIPSYNRNNFKELIEYNLNLNIHNYNDNDKGYFVSEVIIYEDGLLNPIKELKLINKKVKITIINKKDKISIGEKRNKLIKLSKTKYSCFMDTDDIYFYNYFSSSINNLKNYKKKITGSSDMLFYFTSYKKTGSMKTNGNINLSHEATMFFETDFIKKNMKFKDVNAGEGVDFLNGFEQYYIENSILNIMVCVEHKNNTVDKKKWFNPKNEINLNINEYIKIISKLEI